MSDKSENDTQCELAAWEMLRDCRKQLSETREYIATLLRAIHRDCGEYQAEVGTKKAVDDALLVVLANAFAHAECIKERDAVQDELEETRSSAEKIIRSLSAYANRVANEAPRTIRVQGNAARTKAGLWLAKYEKKGGGK